MRLLFSTGFLLLLLPLCFSQKELRDSLQNELNSREFVDASYVDLLNDLSFEYIKSEPDQSLPFINEAIRLADSIGYNPGLVRATTNKGNSFWVIGLQDQALSYYLLALSQSDDTLPLNYARLNNNIGEVFKKKHLYDSAMKYYTEAWKVVQQVEGRRPSIIAYNIAETFLFQNNMDSSAYYYSLGKQYAEESNDKRGLAYSYFGLAEISFREGNVDTALSLHGRSLKLRLEIEDHRGAIQNYLKLAEYFLNNGSTGNSATNIGLAKELSRKINANDLLLDACYLEYTLFTQLGQYQNASRVLNGYQKLKDSIRMEEFSNTVDKIKTSLLAEISSRENQLLIQEQRTDRQVNEARLFLVITLAILIIISIWLGYQFRERRRLIKHQEETDLLIEKLRSRNKNLEEFNNVVSHNLREPLTQIIGYSKFYEQGNTGLSGNEIIGHIKRSSFRIDQTIRDLSTVLNEKEPESGDFRNLCLRVVVDEVLENFEEEIRTSDTKVSVDIDESIIITSYKPFLHDIFHHLISNSLRFRDPDRPLQIVIEASTLRNEVRVRLADNGVGMSQQKVKNKIFRMYQKFHPELSGKGVGLYVVKSRLEALSGKISFESTEGAGSAFILSLPLN